MGAVSAKVQLRVAGLGDGRGGRESWYLLKADNT